MKVFGHFVYVFLSTAGLAHAAFYFLAMPDPMASHFGFGGSPDAWVSRNAFYIGVGVVYTLNTVIFLGVPQLARNIPDSLLKLPRKAYWLATGRREVFYRLFISRMAWAGNFSLLFFSGVLHLVFLANLIPVPKINEFWTWMLTASYFVFLIAWIVMLFWKLIKGVRE